MVKLGEDWDAGDKNQLDSDRLANSIDAVIERQKPGSGPSPPEITERACQDEQGIAPSMKAVPSLDDHMAHAKSSKAVFDDHAGKQNQYFGHAYANRSFDYLDPRYNLPPFVVEFLGIVTGHPNGLLTSVDMDDICTLIRKKTKAREHNSASFDYSHESKAVRDCLEVWDLDKSGTVDISELMAAAEAQRKMKNQNTLLKRLVILAIIVILVLMSATFALSLAAVEMSRQTSVGSSGIMVNKDTGKPIAINGASTTMGLLDLAKPTANTKALMAVSNLHVVTVGGDTFGMTIVGFSRDAAKTTLRSSDGYAVVVSRSSATLRTPKGLEYKLKTPSSSGRRLSGDDSYVELAMKSDVDDPEATSYLKAESSAAPKDIQDSECHLVYDQMDCEVIDKCNWDYAAGECFWRCNYLMDNATCTTKGAAPLPPRKRTRGCHWFKEPSAITDRRCNYDCPVRTSFSECLASPSCMWTGKKCDNSCANYVETECKVVAAEGICTWVIAPGGSQSCKQSCPSRPDRDTCDPTGAGTVCEWDDCKRKCKDSTKVVEIDEAGKRKLQLGSDCTDRGVNSRWYWDYQCTGKHSHCWIEDYKTINAVWRPNATGFGNKCDFGTFDLKHCLPDCEALNKLALDPAYAQAEPKLDKDGKLWTSSLAKVEHYCKVEKAYCSWSGGKCTWKQSCDESWPSQIMKTKPAVEQQRMVEASRMDMCDMQTCSLARSGGGGTPIDLHGRCMDVKVVRNVGRLRNQRCFLKCELRTSQEHCMSQGEGGRLQDSYKGKPCGAMKLTESGDIDDASGKWYFPQQCVSMCQWTADKCLTACEFKDTAEKCGTPETTGCTWNADGKTGVIEFGGYPDLIPCTGTPKQALFVADKIEQQAKDYLAASKQKGGAGYIGPVSTCILAAELAGGDTAAKMACYTRTRLGLDMRYETKYVAPTPGPPPPAPHPSQCVQDPATIVTSPKLYVVATKGDAVTSTDTSTVNTWKWKDVIKKGFAAALTFQLSDLHYKVAESAVDVSDLSREVKAMSFNLVASVKVTLPKGHRPSSLLDKIAGNIARGKAGILQDGSDPSKNFASFFTMNTFSTDLKTSLFKDDEWNWEFKASLGSPPPAPAPPPLTSCEDCKSMDLCGDAFPECNTDRCPTECASSPSPSPSGGQGGQGGQGGGGGASGGPCKDDGSWDAGYGGCSTYAAGTGNHVDGCPWDEFNGITAKQACKECGECT